MPKTPQEKPLVISARQAAVLLGVDKRTLIAMVKREELPAYWVGNAWKFKREDIDVYLEKHRYQKGDAIDDVA